MAGVEYVRVDRDYFEARGLRRAAGTWSLWAMGVGAVISGDFFGWNFGLGAGGFGGLFVATLVMVVMYAGLCFSIAEMSPALPHTGGAYSFARTAMGPFAGYVTGLAENMEFVLTPAVIVVGIGGYLGAIFGTPDAWQPLWWLLTYAVFVTLNIAGAELSFRVTVIVTVLALAILAVFYVGAIPHFDLERYAFDVEPQPGASRFLPKGWLGVLGALPFAMWFFLAIEQLPLAAEESHDPVRDLPRGLLYGFATLVACALATLLMGAGIAPGARALSTSNEPLFDGLRTVFGAGLGHTVLALVAVTGLVASFHSILFAYGRQIYSLSRAGYFPRVLSLTHRSRKTPHVALVAGAVLGYGAALGIFYLGGDHPVGAALINLAVFGAVVSYALQMTSFLVLRFKFPALERPYRSPLGVAGAAVALMLALVTLGTLLIVDPVYRQVVLLAVGWFGAGLLYFFLVGRRRLVYAPEEEFALRARESE